MDAMDRVAAQWASERPDLDTNPMILIGRILRIAKHLETSISALHKEYDLKLGEFDVLATLLRSSSPYELTPSDLINSLFLTSGAMTNRLDKLENKGLIVREHSKEDRRSVTVKLTNQGIELINELIERHVETQHQLVSSLSFEEREQVNDLVKSWLGQFESA
jgi:DNA-binding MarR family transcriptional regulator